MKQAAPCLLDSYWVLKNTDYYYLCYYYCASFILIASVCMYLMLSNVRKNTWNEKKKNSEQSTLSELSYCSAPVLWKMTEQIQLRVLNTSCKCHALLMYWVIIYGKQELFMIPSICSFIYSCCIFKLKLYSTGSVCTLVEFWGLTRQIRKKSNTNGSSIEAGTHPITGLSSIFH